MLNPPDYKNRSPGQILSEHPYFDSVGHVYRAVSWLDYFEHTKRFSSLLYSCMEARMGIEHLLFEELVVSTGFRLDKNDYEKCLRSRMKFRKLIQNLSPDYEKLQQFTRVALELMRLETDGSVPQLVFWKIRDLEQSWGKLSAYLHWSGASNETTGDPARVSGSYIEVRDTISFLWERMSSGPTGILHFDDMKPHVRDIWADYRNDEIDIDSVRRRLKLVGPAH